MLSRIIIIHAIQVCLYSNVKPTSDVDPDPAVEVPVLIFFTTRLEVLITVLLPDELAPVLVVEPELVCVEELEPVLVCLIACVAVLDPDC